MTLDENKNTQIMTKSKANKDPVWKIALGICAVISGIYMTMSFGFIPSWWLYNVPKDLSFLLKGIAIGATLFFISILWLVHSPMNTIKDLSTKFGFLVAWLNIVLIGKRVLLNFSATTVELGLLLIFGTMLYVSIKLERHKLRRHKSTD